jgi:hypothetical protein
MAVAARLEPCKSLPKIDRLILRPHAAAQAERSNPRSGEAYVNPCNGRRGLYRQSYGA